MPRYAQFVIGPAGCGKSTYCSTIENYTKTINRTIHVINLDPDAEHFDYQPFANIKDLISLDDLKSTKNFPLGPNGGLVYCLEYLGKNLSWLDDQIGEFEDDYFLFDCPGQVELYCHLDVIQRIIEYLRQKHFFNICTVFILDCHFLTDVKSHLTSSLIALSSTQNLLCPHINLMMKVDMLSADGQRKISRIAKEDLNVLAACPILGKAKNYKDYLTGLVEILTDGNYGRFLPMNIELEESIGKALFIIDNSIGYGEDLDNYVSNNESTINLYYQLDMRFVNVTGQWICQYDEQKSLPIEISKYVQPMETSTATQKITQKYESSTVTSMFSTTVLSFFPNFDLKMAIFVIISLGFSVIFNLILIGVVCITRKKFQRSRRRTKKKEISRDITETNSMLTRSSTHQQMLNRSNCSRTPSLDSPSFRESIATYLPDGSTIISANILPRESSSYYVDHCGRIIGILQPLNNYHLDTTDLMSRHSSGESASAFISAIHTNSMMPQKVSTHPSNNANWSHGTPQHQDSYSSTRACSSKQQVYGDSNDESGLGSQSLNHSIKQKHGSFCAGSDKVDLILDCDPSINNISRPPLNIQS